MSVAANSARPETLLQFGTSARLPLVRQVEATECGLACLAMVAGYHGFVADLQILRRRFPISGQGTNLSTLIEIAGRLDLGSRALKVDLDALKQLQTPCILHWDLNHFVVLKSLSRKKATIHDPAAGVRHLKLAAMKDFCARKFGPVQIGAVEHDLEEVSAFEASIDKVCSAQNGTAEVGTG